jgi:hypothetical protein
MGGGAAAIETGSAVAFLTGVAISVSTVGAVLTIVMPTEAGADPKKIEIDLDKAAAERAAVVAVLAEKRTEAKSGEQVIAGGKARAEVWISRDGCSYAFLADFQREGTEEWRPMWSLHNKLRNGCRQSITDGVLKEINEQLIQDWGQNPFGVLMRALLSGVRQTLGL